MLKIKVNSKTVTFPDLLKTDSSKILKFIWMHQITDLLAED